MEAKEKPDRTIKRQINAPMSAFAFLWLSVANALLFLAWTFLPETFFPFAKNSLVGFSLISLIRIFFCLFLPFLFFTFFGGLSTASYFGQNPGISWTILSFLTGVPCALFVVSTHNILFHFILLRGFKIPLPSYYLSLNSLTDTRSKILFLFAGVILPILASEVFFRGILQPIFPQRKNGIINIFLTACVFSLFLQSPIDFLPALILGILLGFVRKYAGHVLCSMITFLVTAGLIYLLSPLLPFLPYTTSRGDIDAGNTVFTNSCIAFVVGILFLCILLPSCRRNAAKEQKIVQLRGNTPATVIGRIPIWPVLFGFIFFIAVWVFSVEL